MAGLVLQVVEFIRNIAANYKRNSIPAVMVKSGDVNCVMPSLKDSEITLDRPASQRAPSDNCHGD